jgi:hypothetical protein
VNQYAKLFAMVAVTMATTAVAALSDNQITTHEWINIASAGAGACGVFVAPNVPGARYTKFVLAALTAGLMAVASTIDGGLTMSAILQVTIAVVGALGVYALPNASPAPARIAPS